MSRLKQINIFGQIEETDSDGNTRFCQYCGKPNKTKTNFCCKECAEESMKATFEAVEITIDNDKTLQPTNKNEQA